MPKLWSQTIATHHREVRQAILNATAVLAERHGLHAVKMARVARQAGVGRATLYNYFGDVTELLRAWHEHQLELHLEHLSELATTGGSPLERLESVLETFAAICQRHHGSELAALLHRGPHVARAQEQLRDFVRRVLAEGARSGDVRRDVSPAELATYCLHAVTAASTLKTAASVKRLVAVTLAGARRQK